MGGSSVDGGSEKRHGKRKKSKHSSGGSKKVKHHSKLPNTTSDKGSESENEQEYIVEDILDKKKVNGEYQYFIKWLGWPSDTNTWEPVDNLNGCPELLERFEQEWSEKKAEKREKKSSEEPVPSKKESSEEKQSKPKSDKKSQSSSSIKHSQEEKKEKASAETGSSKASKVAINEDKDADYEELDILDKCPSDRVPQKIVGVVPISDVLVYCVEWKPTSGAGGDPISLIRGETFRQKFPEMVIKFYETHIVWTKDAKAEAKLFEEAQLVHKSSLSVKGTPSVNGTQNDSSDDESGAQSANHTRRKSASSDSSESNQSKENYHP